MNEATNNGPWLLVRILLPSLHVFLKFYLIVISSSSLHHPIQNRLLAALPAIELDDLAPHLELVHLPLGDALCKRESRFLMPTFPLLPSFPSIAFWKMAHRRRSQT
jgi:hypothetical protein